MIFFIIVKNVVECLKCIQNGHDQYIVPWIMTIHYTIINEFNKRDCLIYSHIQFSDNGYNTYIYFKQYNASCA